MREKRKIPSALRSDEKKGEEEKEKKLSCVQIGGNVEFNGFLKIFEKFLKTQKKTV